MVITVTVPPCFSFSRTPSSMAYTSKGLMMDCTPSRTRVFVSGLMRTLVVSGTCLMQTMIFTPRPSFPGAVLPHSSRERFP